MTEEEMRRELVVKQARIVELTDRLEQSERHVAALQQQITLGRRLVCFALQEAQPEMRAQLSAAIETLL